MARAATVNDPRNCRCVIVYSIRIVVGTGTTNTVTNVSRAGQGEICIPSGQTPIRSSSRQAANRHNTTCLPRGLVSVGLCTCAILGGDRFRDFRIAVGDLSAKRGMMVRSILTVRIFGLSMRGQRTFPGVSRS